MKVKIFTSYDEDELCNLINKWIEENLLNVVDMKYSNVVDLDGQCFYTVLIMWSEK